MLIMYLNVAVIVSMLYSVLSFPIKRDDTVVESPIDIIETIHLLNAPTDESNNLHDNVTTTGPCTLFAFGNSLTDNGVDSDDPHGFKKYSNGPTWPDYLARYINCNKVDNYGYSGALSGQDNYYFKGWSGTSWQVDQFLKLHPKVSHSAVIGIELGGLNDLFLAADLGTEDWLKLELEIVENNILSMKRLLKAGARNMVVFEIFRPAVHCPATEQDWFKPHADEFMKSLAAVNKMMEAKVNELLYENPNSKIAFVNTIGMWDEMVKKFSKADKFFTHHNPVTKYGDWNEHAWFDEYHPATAVHEMLAIRAFKIYA